MAIATSMAILGAAAVGAVGSVAAGAMQSKAAGKAADAQVQAAELSAGVQRDAAQQSRIDSAICYYAGRSPFQQRAVGIRKCRSHSRIDGRPERNASNHQ